MWLIFGYNRKNMSVEFESYYVFWFDYKSIILDNIRIFAR